MLISYKNIFKKFINWKWKGNFNRNVKKVAYTGL